MEKQIGGVEYRDKAYLTLGIEIDGAYNYFAEEALAIAMEENRDDGCALDNHIVYYPSREQIDGIIKAANANDYDGLKKYLQDEEIFYYKLDGNGRLVGGLTD